MVHAAACIHHLFHQQASATPDAVAVTASGRSLSYRELDERSSRLAHYLVRSGVKSDELVAISMDRSLEMVIGLLGILKSGGAYVPLDPSYPKDRLAFMLEDAGARILLSQRHIAAALPRTRAELLCLDSNWAQVEVHRADMPDLQQPDTSLAYVIYTSGSTGVPKGVMNEHRGVVNHLLWRQQYRPIGAQDRVLQKTPFSFDVSVWEFFWPLLNGARLVMARPRMHADPYYVQQEINQSGITIAHFIPSMLQAFLDSGEAGKCRGLKQIYTSGEALAPTTAEACLAELPQVELHNLYGPTEAAVEVSYWQCPRGQHLHTVPIGRPVANTQLYIVQENNPACAAHEGELLIGGVQVARGYHKRPELTAERFIPNPFGEGRVYRTGDLCRWMDDGNIEYLGRLDFQVKINGVRIELGEIESHLCRAPGVRQCVVMAREDVPGHKRLVAYIVGQADRVDLITRLNALLPAHMVPHIYVCLDTFPLSPNGKINRKALPAPRQRAGRSPQTLPMTDLGRRIAAVWEAMLQSGPVGSSDDFLELGGTSLMAAEMLAHLRTDMGLHTSLPAFFRSPTIAGIIAYDADPDVDDSQSHRVLREGDGRGPVLLCLPGAGGHSANFAAFAEHIIPGIGVHAVDYQQSPREALTVPGESQRLLGILQQVLDGRSVFLCGYSLGGYVAHELACMLMNAGSAPLGVIMIDTPVNGFFVAPLWYRAVRHMSHLARGGVANKWQYLRDRHLVRRLLEIAAQKGTSSSMIPEATWDEDSYVPGPYAGTLQLIRASSNPEYQVPTTNDPTMGWSACISGEIHVEYLPGAHLDILKPALAKELADLANRYIQKTMAKYRLAPYSLHQVSGAPRTEMDATYPGRGLNECVS